MNNIGFRFLVTTILAALLIACGSAPPAITEGEQPLEIRTMEWKHQVDPLTGAEMGRTEPAAVEGARCTLGNDKGSWTTTTPGTVRVLRSSGVLEIECVKPGYKPARLKAQCRSPRQDAQGAGKGSAVAILVFAPLAIAAAPYAPAAAAQLGGQLLVYGTGALVANATLGADADLCQYRVIALTLTRPLSWP